MMMYLNRSRLVAISTLVVVFFLLLTGCETVDLATGVSEENQATGNNRLADTATPTSLAEFEPVKPSTTPSPPPAVVIVSEEATDAQNESEAATAEPTTIALPQDFIGPDNFAADVNPLTGETVSDPAVLARRPVAIKISNAPPIVRPQAGLNKADLVFEHYAEGGLTRFTAVFYSQDADPVGSIRSGRLIDIEIPQMYDAAFAYSGSSGPLQLMFRNGTFFERIISPDFGHGGFFRVEDPNKAFEHTLFTSTHNLRFILDERGQNTPPDFQTNMVFSPTPATSGDPVSKVEIQYDGTNVTWVYNAGSERYTRWMDGVPHLDANSGQQLSFKNIIALAAHHEDTDILEDNVAGGHLSIQIQIWGEGPVSIFRNGLRIDGSWRRQDPSHMITFYDQAGNLLPLSPGNSFIEVIPLGFDRLFVTP
jgi:hypothetical protein